MFRKSIGLSLLLVSLTASFSEAALFVEVLPTTLTAGGTGFVDVVITSTSPGTDLLGGWSTDFVLAPTGGTSTTFEWADPQTGAPTLADPSYVFASGTPGVGLLGPGPIDSANIVFGFPGPAVTMAGTVATWGDSAIDPALLLPADALVAGPGVGVLLARLEVAHILPGGVDPATTIGDTFSISLESTLFTLADGTALIEDTDYFLIDGLVTVAVPEPGSILLGGLTCMFAGLFRRRRKQIQPTA